MLIELSEEHRAVILAALQLAIKNDFMGGPTLSELADIKAVMAALAPHAVGQPSPNWQDAPSWSNWWCVNANGLVRWSNAEPQIEAKYPFYRFPGGSIDKEDGYIDIPLGVDWRTLKVQRHTPAPTLAE